MTHAQATELLNLIRGTWSQATWTEQMIAAWLQRLPKLPRDDAYATYEALLNRGSAFTPSLAEFVAATAEVRQGPPPTAEQADQIIGRNATKWPYRHHVTAHEHTVGAIKQLMGKGVHEAVCRFVQQVGGRECADMPDASQGLDTDASVRRHMLLDTYRKQSVPSWKADPTPGLALKRAVERVGLDPGTAPRRIGEGLKSLAAGD